MYTRTQRYYLTGLRNRKSVTTGTGKDRVRNRRDGKTRYDMKLIFESSQNNLFGIYSGPNYRFHETFSNIGRDNFLCILKNCASSWLNFCRQLTETPDFYLQGRHSPDTMLLSGEGQSERNSIVSVAPQPTISVLKSNEQALLSDSRLYLALFFPISTLLADRVL